MPIAIPADAATTTEVAATIETFFATINTPVSDIGTEAQDVLRPVMTQVLARNADDAEMFYYEMRPLVLEVGEFALDYAPWNIGDLDTVIYVNSVFNFFRDNRLLDDGNPVGIFTA